jgi:ubiquitin C-terminal hydrolase
MITEMSTIEVEVADDVQEFLNKINGEHTELFYIETKKQKNKQKLVFNDDEHITNKNTLNLSSTVKGHNPHKGLINIGKTCYINVVLHILASLYEFEDIINARKKILLNNDTNTKLMEILISTLKNIREHENFNGKMETLFDPSTFVKMFYIYSKELGNQNFDQFMQGDSNELLLFLIDVSHKSVKRKIRFNINGMIQTEEDAIKKRCLNVFKISNENDYSEIKMLFECVQYSLLRSTDDNKLKNIIVDQSLGIFLSIPNKLSNMESIDDLINNSTNTVTMNVVDKLSLFRKNKKIHKVTLIECLDRYMKEDVMIINNISVNKYNYFWTLPKILMITLNRFDNNSNKINTLVEFDLHDLDMSKYYKGESTKVSYELICVCNHEGSSINEGHYTVSIKHENNIWYMYNDNIVVGISNINDIVTNNVYILVYRQRT